MIITGFILGALTMLIGVLIGHATGKPWLDKRFMRPAPPPTKSLQQIKGE